LDVSLWGASMGGAGATTIGFHPPDRFLAVTSFFGDSRYDLSTYVRAILRDPLAAHRVNALDIVDNARNLPVWLIHGEDDATSPIGQSEMLAVALQQRGFSIRFDRAPGMGHSGPLVARSLHEVVSHAAPARAGAPAPRVTYFSVRPSDTGAYGVRIERASPTGDAFVDVERRDDGLHVRRAGASRARSGVPSRPPRLSSWTRAPRSTRRGRGRRLDGVPVGIEARAPPTRADARDRDGRRGPRPSPRGAREPSGRRRLWSRTVGSRHRARLAHRRLRRRARRARAGEGRPRRRGRAHQGIQRAAGFVARRHERRRGHRGVARSGGGARRRGDPRSALRERRARAGRRGGPALR